MGTFFPTHREREDDVEAIARLDAKAKVQAILEALPQPCGCHDAVSCAGQGPNPKDKYGRAKPSISFIPPVAILAEAGVMELGGEKYGPFNWRDHPVRASVYYDAAFRHMTQWYDGEELDAESGQSHLAHARACFGIILDAEETGCLIDDRPKATGTVSRFIAEHTKLTK